MFSVWTHQTQTPHTYTPQTPQAGTSISRVIPALTSNGTRVTDVFESVRPHMDLTFNNIVAHINTVFVLRTRVDKYCVPGFVGQHSTRSEGSEHFADSNDQLTPHNRRPAEVKRPASPTSEHSKYVTAVHFFSSLPFHSYPLPSLTREERSIERKFRGEREKNSYRKRCRREINFASHTPSSFSDPICKQAAQNACCYSTSSSSIFM